LNAYLYQIVKHHSDGSAVLAINQKQSLIFSLNVLTVEYDLLFCSSSL